MTEQIALSASPIFKDLDARLIDCLLEQGERRDVCGNTSLFCAGDDYNQEIYVVLSGRVQIQRLDGKTYEVSTGDFVGLSSFLDHAPYSATAFCPGPVRLLVVSETCFQDLKQHFPELSTAVNRSISHRLRRWSPERRGASGALVQKVRSTMTSPFAAIGAATTLLQALALMRTRKIGALGVVAAEGGLLGLISPAGIAEQVLLNRASPETPLSEAVVEKALTISPDEPLWQAEQLLQDGDTKYLVVVEDEVPVGMLSRADIVRVLYLHAQSNLLVDRAGEAQDIDALRRLAGALDSVARGALENNRRATTAVRILSEAHLSLSRRCVELTLAQMQQEGLGAPPVAYSILIMGSGGRKEMLLSPDQDNGLILSDAAGSDATVRQWFKQFAERLNLNLDSIGYPLCPGEIMTRNPMFHKTLSEWKAQLSYLAEFPTEKAARWSNVVFDFDTLYGDEALTTALRNHLYDALRKHKRLLTMMVEDDAEGRAPIGFFNRLVTTDEKAHRGRIDIKRSGLRLIADAARIYALSRGVKSCSTFDRISSLVRVGQLDADFADSLISAYGELLAMVLDRQLEQRARGEAVDKLIDPASLTPHQREVLRDSMLAVKRFQEKLQGDFARISF